MYQTLKIVSKKLSKNMKDKNGKNVSHVETNKLVIAHCNIVNNNYQKDLWVYYKFVINKLFGRLLDISPNCSILLKIFNSEFLYIEVWFTDHNCKALEIDDKMNIISVTNWFRIYKIVALIISAERSNICERI